MKTTSNLSSIICFINILEDEFFAIDLPAITQYEIGQLKQKVNHLLTTYSQILYDGNLLNVFELMLSKLKIDSSLNKAVLDEWALKTFNTLFDKGERPSDPARFLAQVVHAEYKKLANSMIAKGVGVNGNQVSWHSRFPIPIMLLSDQQRKFIEQRLKSKINKLSLFDDNTKLKEDLINFINDPTPLPFKNLDRLAIAYQCVEFLVSPHLIDQRNLNLCGPATLMQHIVCQNPEKFVYQTIEMAELQFGKEKHHLPEQIKSYPSSYKETFHDLDDIWLQTIRHNYNPITGYQPLSKLEEPMALTTPYMLERMFKDFGYEVIQENCQIPFANTTMLGRFFETARHKIADYGVMPAPFKFYGAKHKEIRDDDKRFQALCDWYLKSPEKICTILISGDFIKHFLNKDKGSTILGILTLSHYININNFKYNPETDKLSFIAYTWGSEFRIESEGKIFKSVYLGGIFIEPKLEMKPHITLRCG